MNTQMYLGILLLCILASSLFTLSFGVSLFSAAATAFSLSAVPAGAQSPAESIQSTGNNYDGKSLGLHFLALTEVNARDTQTASTGDGSPSTLGPPQFDRCLSPTRQEATTDSTPPEVRLAECRINQKYEQLKRNGLDLGQQVTLVTASEKGGGVYFADFQQGSIYFIPARGTFEIHGGMWDKYRENGTETGFLGLPKEDTRNLPGKTGLVQVFDGGVIYWSRATGAHEIHNGPILDEYAALGWETSPLGFPTTDEKPTLKGDGGRYNLFKGGIIIWNPTSGAHEVHGAIFAKWAKLGLETGLGYPLEDARTTPTKPGWVQNFERAAVYWKDGAKEAFEVGGAILAKYGDYLWEQAFLGFPTSDEHPAPRGDGGRYNTFEGGLIIWHRATGAHEVHGVTLGMYGLLDYEKGCLGYPKSDEVPVSFFGNNGGRTSFQGGTITHYGTSYASYVCTHQQGSAPKAHPQGVCSTAGARAWPNCDWQIPKFICEGALCSAIGDDSASCWRTTSVGGTYRLEPIDCQQTGG